MKRVNDETDTQIAQRPSDRMGAENNRRNEKGDEMLEKSIESGTPDGIAVDLVSDKEYDAYDKALKGSIHAIILPLIIGFVFGAAAGWSYLAAVAVLYGTVFRHKSQGFWAVVAMIVGLGALMIVGGVS